MNLTLFVLGTNRCNLSCKHCYVSSSPMGEFGLTSSAIVDLAKSFNSLFGKSLFTLSGGEFMTRRDLLEILPALSEFHELMLLTNGTLITESFALEAAKHNWRIRIGLDGVSAEAHDEMRGPGAFARAMRGLRRLGEAGVRTGNLELFFTAVPENIADIPSLFDLAEEYSIGGVVVEPVAVHGRAAVYWKSPNPDGSDAFRNQLKTIVSDLLPRIEQRWVARERRHNSVLTVDFNGDVFAFTPVDQLDVEVGRLGNVLRESLPEIVKGDRFRSAELLKAMRFLRGQGGYVEAKSFVRRDLQ